MNGWSTGWGNSYVNGPVSTVLNQVQMPIFTNSKCASYLNGFGLVVNTTTQMCAGTIGVNQGICQGDSGNYLCISI